MNPFGASSALDPAGPHAAEVARLWWILFALTAGVYLAVVALMALAVFGRKRVLRVRRASYAVGAGGAFTLLVLLALLGASVHAGKGMHPPASTAGLTIRVIGHQWWWEIVYPGAPEDQTVTTANELHIPVHTPVLVELVARDVIHSFWVPSLHGKRDLIPGHDSTTFLQADRPGLYHGQCAELCGVGHARMSFLVVAEEPANFQKWLAAQRRPATPPIAEAAVRGRQLFLGTTCSSCHTIVGDQAGGRMGPDLTHFASRLSLGSATRPNVAPHLARWIRDPAEIKPGVHMPGHDFSAREMDDLVSFLAGLE